MGKAPARQALKARTPLKADASEAGEAWSDGRIAETLDASLDSIAGTHQQPFGGAIDAVLARKQSANSARERVSDGAAEVKLIALACSALRKGRKRWTLTSLETASAKLNIADHAATTPTDVRSSLTIRSNGSSHRRPMPPS
jgi:hypothetical protein